MSTPDSANENYFEEAANEGGGNEATSTNPSEWGNTDPNFIITEMRNLNAKDRGRNKKDFFKSPQYSNWTKMSLDQKNKSLAWFNLLLPSIQSKNIFEVYDI